MPQPNGLWETKEEYVRLLRAHVLSVADVKHDKAVEVALLFYHAEVPLPQAYIYLMRLARKGGLR